MTRAATDQLTLFCTTCGQLVEDKAVVGIRVQDLRDYSEALAEWTKKNPGPSHDMRAFMSQPDGVQWHIAHHDCDPDERLNYFIDVHRFRTWRQVAEWSAHLSEKDWFKDTDWAVLVRRLQEWNPER